MHKDDTMLQHSMAVLEGTSCLRFTLRIPHVYVLRIPHVYVLRIPQVYVLRNTTLVQL